MYQREGQFCANGFETITVLGLSAPTLKKWIKKQVAAKLIEEPPQAMNGTQLVPCYPAEYLARIVKLMGLPVPEVVFRVQASKKLDTSFKEVLIRELQSP